MTHIASIGAAMYSDLSVHFGSGAKVDVSLPANPGAITNWATMFGTESASAGVGNFTRIPNIREFPAIGTPASIVRVPLFGQKTSMSIQGQADAPQLEMQLNYVPTEWASGTLLGDSVADKVTHAFRFTLLNEVAPGYSSTASPTGIGGATLSPVGNSQYFWLGKIEALLIKPALTDATTATLTLSIQSDFYGAYTTAAG